MTGRRSADLYACGSIKNGSTSRGRSEKRDGRPLEPPPSPALLVGTLAAALITGLSPFRYGAASQSPRDACGTTPKTRARSCSMPTGLYSGFRGGATGC